MTSSPVQPGTQASMFRSERAMLFLGAIALISSLMLWWTGHLSRTAYPQHIALNDNLQQARQSINIALLRLNRHLAGEVVPDQDITVALNTAMLKLRDCLEGRSTLVGIPAVPPSGSIRLLLQSYAESLHRLDQTVRALMDANNNRNALQIEQRKKFHELSQIGDTLETELARTLAQVVAKAKLEQQVGLAFWFFFLLAAFFLLYRTARIDNAQSQQEQLIHALLDSTSDAIFVKDRAGRYLFCNQAARQFLGKKNSEILGHDDSQVFPEAVAQELIERDRAIMDSGLTSHHEENLITLKGDTLYFLVAKGVLRDRNGQVNGLFGISRDITQQRRDEEQLHHNRLMLQRTSRLAKVGGWEFDPQTLKGSWTEECARIHDLAPDEEISALQGLTYFQGEHRRRIEQALQAAVNHGQPYDLELEMITAKEVRKWVRTQCEPVVENGKIIYLYGALQDITERKAAEEALRASEQALKEAQRLAEIGNWRWQVLEDIHTWSEEVYRIYGRDPHLPPARYPEEEQYFSGDSWISLNKAVQRCLQTGKSYICDAEVIRTDGSHRWVTIRGEALPGKDGTVHSLIGTVQDITERKKTEETLRDSEMRYRTLFNQSMDAIAIMEGFPPQIRTVNQAFVELFGYTEAETRAMTGDQVWKMIFPEDRPIVQASLKDRMDGRINTVRYEFRVLRKDGEMRWVEVTGSMAKLGLQLINQTIYRDITPRKQAEEAQKTLQEQLNQAQKMESVGRLAGGIAHDFNNMLSVILGGIDLMEDQLEPEAPLGKDLQDIKKAAERSVDLTRQLLAFARKQTISPKVLDMNATVEGLLKMLRRLIGEDIDLAWSPAGQLWPVNMDPSQVDQLLANLCINARDAIEGTGKLTIETENAVFDAYYCAKHLECVPGEYVLLAVSDNGCGMDRATRDKIFEPFFTTKRMGEGTGLGLATVYGIVRQNNGFIHVYSEPGQGSTFKIYLPRYGGELQTESENPQADILPVSGITVLLVEDEQALLELNERILLGLGYSVLAATTPDEAILLASRHPDQIDILLTDVVMPGMNGQELAKKLEPLVPHIHQVFMSGYTANVIAHHGVLDQGVHFLQKPFSKRDLAAKLQEVLTESSSG
ncbi:MAG: PAS domain S-box protein [Desulfobulbus sp.]|nr:PAS domain S-box protein [Desulfobulbus sp.]